jgi:N6-L-threonylcarbamoyladenine synthase
MPGLDFSFSGIKTSFLYFLRDEKAKDPTFVEKNLKDICASLQRQLIKMLLDKIEKAIKETGIRAIAIAGGVSANSGLRKELQLRGQKSGWIIFIPAMQYCTDNAAMIGMAAHFKFLKHKFCDLSVAPQANLMIGQTI